MISISKRLQTIAELVLDGNSRKIIDVGCDHALLDIYLLQNNENLKIIASDNKKAPLESARKNIERYSFLNKIELSLRDGIESIDDDIDTIVIAGMGMDTIVEILEKNKNELKKIERLIISSNNKYAELREKICALGFYIKEERIIFDDRKFYIAIEFIKGIKNYSKKELYFGPILLTKKEKIFKEYYTYLLNEKRLIYDSLPENHYKKELIKKEIELLNEEIK